MLPFLLSFGNSYELRIIMGIYAVCIGNIFGLIYSFIWLSAFNKENMYLSLHTHYSCQPTSSQPECPGASTSKVMVHLYVSRSITSFIRRA